MPLLFPSKRESHSPVLSALCLFTVANGDNVATFIVTCGIVTEVPTPVSPRAPPSESQ